MGIRKIHNVDSDEQVGSGLTLEEFAKLLHTEEDAFVTVSYKDKNDKWVEKNYLINDWFNHVMLDEDTSSYNSVNTFYKPSRANENTRHVNAFYVDMDVYNGGISKQDAIDGIDFLVRTERLLEPTFIIDSGRGLYGIWKIESAPGKYKSVQKLYSRLEEFLIEITKDLGSDKQASDLARVLRTPGSFNPKSKSVVKVLRYTEKIYTMRLMQELMNDVNGVDWSIETKKFVEKPKDEKAKRKPGKLTRLFNFYTLAMSRARDLEKVSELRNGEMTGFRNTLLHIYCYQMMLIHKDLNVSKYQTKVLNESLSDPLTNQEITDICKSVYKAYQDHLKDKEKGYNYRNNTIIEKLKITAAEQKEMKTLIDKDEKNERQKEANKKKRRNKNGLTPKQQEVKDRQEKVLKLHGEGLSQTEIAEKLGITRMTISRDFKFLSL